MRIASVWHTHRSTDATPDDSQFRWCPVEYLHHMANLTWTRVCSGQCEKSHGPVCTPVPTCNIEGDYPIFQVFFEPHHLRYEDNIVSGLDLHSVLSSSNVHSWCQYRNMMPQVVAPSRMLIVAGMQSDGRHQFGNVGQCHRSVLFNKCIAAVLFIPGKRNCSCTSRFDTKSQIQERTSYVTAWICISVQV